MTQDKHLYYLDVGIVKTIQILKNEANEKNVEMYLRNLDGLKTRKKKLLNQMNREPTLEVSDTTKLNSSTES
jgi:hypothetical protein